MTSNPLTLQPRRSVKFRGSLCNDPPDRLCRECSSCTLGTIYCLNYIKFLVEQGNWEYANWKRTERTLDKYGWEDEDVEAVILNMTVSNFQHVAPGCTITEIPGNSCVDADQYETFWDGAYLSVKLALVSDEQGEFAGLVTFHSSGS